MAGKSKWSGAAGFIAASIGSAVGLGNLWRFPYVVGEYGLGTFIIVYLIGMLFVGIPVMILEYFVGDKIRKTPILGWKKISKLWFIPYIPLLFLFIILSYYIVISGWALLFLAHSLINIPFKFSDITTNYLSLVGALAVILIGWWVSRRKISSGLEEVNKIFVPLLFLIIIILASIAIYQYGFVGITKLLEFNPAQFLNANTWLMALSQASFSLDVGWLILFTYAAYSTFKYKDMIKYSAIVAISDTFIALISAVFVFTIAVGNNLPVDKGPTFMFDTIGTLVNSFPFSNILLPLLFLTLFSAAITSVISMFEVLRRGVEDITKRDRKTTSDILAFFLLIASSLSALSYSIYNLQFNGTKILDFLDGIVIGKFSVLSILLIIIALGWWSQSEKLAYKASKNYGRYLLFLWRYILPIFLAVIFIVQWI